MGVSYVIVFKVLHLLSILIELVRVFASELGVEGIDSSLGVNQFSLSIVIESLLVIHLCSQTLEFRIQVFDRLFVLGGGTIHVQNLVFKIHLSGSKLSHVILHLVNSKQGLKLLLKVGGTYCSGVTYPEYCDLHFSISSFLF